MLVVNTCLHCSADFSHRHDWEKAKYCSRKCYVAHRRGWTRTCPQCGELFPVGTGAETCSPACGYARRRAQLHGVRGCQACGKQLPQRGKTSRKFCNRSCSSVNRNASYPHHPNGGITSAGGGYLRIKIDGAWRAHHRHVMEQVIGRPLEEHERVHHRNGDRADNRPENLELWKVKSKDPPGVRASDYHCAGCRCGK